MSKIAIKKEQSSWFDVVLWAVFYTIIAFSLFLYVIFPEVSSVVKLLFSSFLILLLLSVAFFTKKGKIAYTFVQEAFVEMRKVVWPARDEVVQITVMVSAVIAVISLLLWVIDSSFAAFVSYLTV